MLKIAIDIVSLIAIYKNNTTELIKYLKKNI